MRSRDIKTANLIAWHLDRHGYLKCCSHCGRGIYLKLDHDGVWRPYESWVEGWASVGQWRLHDCWS